MLWEVEVGLDAALPYDLVFDQRAQALPYLEKVVSLKSPVNLPPENTPKTQRNMVLPLQDNVRVYLRVVQCLQ